MSIDYLAYTLAGASIGCIVAVIVLLIEWRHAMTFSELLLKVIATEREQSAADAKTIEDLKAQIPSAEAQKALTDRALEIGAITAEPAPAPQ